MAKLTATISHPRAGNHGLYVIPTSPSSPWHQVNSVAAEPAGTAEQNSGTRITIPGTVDNDSNITTVDTKGFATTIEIAMRYLLDGTTSQECVVNVFGVDSNGLFQALPDSDGDIDIELTAHLTNDVKIDGTNDVTTAKKVDLLGNQKYEVHVMSEFDMTGGTETADIIAREY